MGRGTAVWYAPVGQLIQGSHLEFAPGFAVASIEPRILDTDWRAGDSKVVLVISR